MEHTYRFSAREALDKLSANTFMTERAIAGGYVKNAAFHAELAAHWGALILEPGIERHGDVVSDPQHLTFAELILASLGGAL